MCPHRGFCAVSLCKDALVFIPAKPVYYGYSNQQNAPQKTAVLCDTGKGEFIMARVYNFSAGPSMLPEKVLRQAQAELLEYGDSGQSVMEMSHRSKWFDAIIKDTEATLRRVMNIPDNYKVGFFQGGATQQFAMVPLNFMTTGKADYLVTGNFSNLAAKEAAKFGEVNIVASSKDKNFTYIPDVNAINYDKDASYIHICQNNTIFGTQFVEVPQVEGVPLVADMSSMILSKPVDVTKYGCIYFGVQKNVAPAGMAIAIVRDDLLGHAADNVPTMMNYTTLLGKDSMYNTPPCWCIYMTGLVLKYLENDIGGLANMQKINEAKAKVLYDYLDGQGFFTNPVEHRYRSTMNVTFTSPNADLDKKFCAEAAEAGFVNLKGDTGKGEFIMARVYNFSAGPSMLPEKVLRQAQAELLEYGDSGQSVMEMSHRSKWFDAIIKDTEATLRRVMNIPDNYKVGFFQGGATQQFAMVPLNFMTTGKADYLVTGNFSNLAAKEAAKFGEVNIVASSKDKNFTYIPDVNAINYDKDASYIHICQNNTIFGTQFVEVPQVEGVPLVADMSSMILSKPVDVTKYGCIYFGVQKNVAPAGMAIAIVRDDLLGHAADNVPTMMNYTTLLGKDSMYNTPPCWCIYMTGLVLKYLENDIGGLANMQKINEAKAKVLYDYLDGQGFFTNPVEHRYRSTMNVTFTSPNADLDKKFCAEAAEAGFVNLKGHRLVGGMRASIYNAMPAEGVDKLVDFMEKFRKENA